MSDNAARPALLKPADIDVDEVLKGLLEWVGIETPSTRPDQINTLLDVAERDVADLPIERRRVPGRDGRGDHLVLAYNPAGSNEASAFAMGHVEPSGQSARWNCARSAPTATGSTAPAFTT